jgi:hypothetical protein
MKIEDIKHYPYDSFKEKRVGRGKAGPGVGFGSAIVHGAKCVEVRIPGLVLVTYESPKPKGKISNTGPVFILSFCILFIMDFCVNFHCYKS